LEKAALVGKYSPHSFRVTVLTRFLEEGGTLEAAQNIADHADSRQQGFMIDTNKLCFERALNSTLEEVAVF
jgi:hypothetical protein